MKLNASCKTVPHYPKFTLWYQPALEHSRDHLLQQEKLQATTARAYLSTVRSAYRQLLRSNEVRQWLYDRIPPDLSPERQFALMPEFKTRLKNDLDANNAPVIVVKVQDESDTDHLWLTPAQVASLVLTPCVETLKGVRDTAMVALMLCIGVLAAELLALNVDDLQVMFEAHSCSVFNLAKARSNALSPMAHRIGD